MKILIEGAKERYDRFMPQLPFLSELELFFCPRGTSNQQKLALAPDADILFVDAISRVVAELIEKMPHLKMIHSEGVAFNGIDLTAAQKAGIYVCNNKGCNAGAVAEQAILLMLELLRQGITGDKAVRQGKQMAMKESCMIKGIAELSQCKIGLVGFGDIAKATALRLAPFGCQLYYYTPQAKEKDMEDFYHVSYLPLADLAATCDIISIHCAVTKDTQNLINAEFFAKMKSNAYLINTARGEIVDNIALKNAIVNEQIASAGLDTVFPEPTPADHILLTLPKEYQDRIVFTPHLGGITTASFQRAHAHMWQNAQRIYLGQKPDHIVNGL